MPCIVDWDVATGAFLYLSITLPWTWAELELAAVRVIELLALRDSPPDILISVAGIKGIPSADNVWLRMRGMVDAVGPRFNRIAIVGPSRDSTTFIDVLFEAARLSDRVYYFETEDEARTFLTTATA